MAGVMAHLHQVSSRLIPVLSKPVSLVIIGFIRRCLLVHLIIFVFIGGCLVVREPILALRMTMDRLVRV